MVGVASLCVVVVALRGTGVDSGGADAGVNAVSKFICIRPDHWTAAGLPVSGGASTCFLLLTLVSFSVLVETCFTLLIYNLC